jgi:hypothetical protein
VQYHSPCRRFIAHAAFVSRLDRRSRNRRGDCGRQHSGTRISAGIAIPLGFTLDVAFTKGTRTIHGVTVSVPVVLPDDAAALTFD